MESRRVKEVYGTEKKLLFIIVPFHSRIRNKRLEPKRRSNPSSNQD
jgi:hypothetical protein